MSKYMIHFIGTCMKMIQHVNTYACRYRCYPIFNKYECTSSDRQSKTYGFEYDDIVLTRSKL